MKVCQYCGWNDGEHADGCENENAEPLPVRPESAGSVSDRSKELAIAEKLSDLCLELVRLLK